MPQQIRTSSGQGDETLRKEEAGNHIASHDSEKMKDR